jgi:hypothetical protein
MSRSFRADPPSPVLPLRGVGANALARSLAATVAFDPHPKVGRISCSTATSCSVPFADSLRGAKGTATYSVQGEQVPGCWLATLTRVEREPADAEVSMPSTLGGCVNRR